LERQTTRHTVTIVMATLRAETSALLIAIRFCPGTSRRFIKRLQRAAVPASKLACMSAADPQRRYMYEKLK